MNISPLVYLATAATLGLLIPLLNSIKPSGEAVEIFIFGYSKGLRIFIWIGSIVFASMGFIFKAFGVDGTTMQWIAIEVMGAAMIFGCVYTDKYSVELTDEALVFGAFRKKLLQYSDIKSADVRRSGRGRILDIRTLSGERCKLDGNIQYFDDLAKKLNQRLGSA